MEKIKNFFKGKGIGYYIVMADVVLALVLSIVFFATYKTSMANNAAAHLPEVIGWCALLGGILDIVALLLAEFKYVHLLSLFAYCVSLAKEVYLIPNLIADQVNGVAYQGGNFPINVFYLVMLLVIIISGIVATFLGLLNEEGIELCKAEAKESGTKLPKKTLYRICAGAATAVVAVAVVGTSLSIASKKTPTIIPDEIVLDDIQKSYEDKKIEYDFDPNAVIYKEDTHPYVKATKEQIVNNVSSAKNRFTHHKVYEFEGKYTEAYQGNFNFSYSYIYLWEDGLYNGTANGSNIYGYWYNRTAEGTPCLVMRDTDGNDMVCDHTKGDPYYDWFTDLKTNLNGGRTFKMNGFMYSPIIGMFIDTGSASLTYDFLSEIDKTDWTPKIIRNDLRYGALFNRDEVKWQDANTKVVGDQVIEATWEDTSNDEPVEFTYDIPVTIGADLGEYQFTYAEGVKKNYRYVDAFDATGITCERTVNGESAPYAMSDITPEFNIANNTIDFKMQNGKTYSMEAIFDTSAESNTIHAKNGEEDMTIVLTSRKTATVTCGEKTADINITLSGNSGLATIAVDSKVSGDEDLFNALPATFGLSEDSETHALNMLVEKYMRSSTKANGYNQKTDSFFIFGTDPNVVTLIWQFDYQGMHNEVLKATYTMSGTSLHLVDKISDSENQWQWISKDFSNLTDCQKSELPFEVA